jgi:hypothetical protein
MIAKEKAIDQRFSASSTAASAFGSKVKPIWLHESSIA